MDLNNVLHKLQQVLYGYNYEVTFGVEIFNNCETLEEFKLLLKNKFPDSRPDSVEIVPVTNDEFWEEIEYALEYRGDSSAGVQLDHSDQRQFLLLKNHYVNYLRTHVEPNSKVFLYPDEWGIPGYPVFWDFRFVILSKGAVAIFVYGSASD
jgi:hypothetical protein